MLQRYRQTDRQTIWQYRAPLDTKHLGTGATGGTVKCYKVEASEHWKISG